MPHLFLKKRSTDFRISIIVDRLAEWWLNMDRKQIDNSVEQLCVKGCLAVREDIKLLQQGVVLPEIRDLDELGRKLVLKELESIMAVYGDLCPVDRKIRFW